MTFLCVYLHLILATVPLMVPVPLMIPPLYRKILTCKIGVLKDMINIRDVHCDVLDTDQVE